MAASLLFIEFFITCVIPGVQRIIHFVSPSFVMDKHIFNAIYSVFPKKIKRLEKYEGFNACI